MGSNSTTRAIPMIVILVLILLSGTRADSSNASPAPAMERGAGLLVPPLPRPLLPKSATPDQDCPLIQVPDLVDACRSPPGLRGCAAQCIVYHYRGGYCQMLPDGRPGDCFCKNCLTSSDA